MLSPGHDGPSLESNARRAFSSMIIISHNQTQAPGKLLDKIGKLTQLSAVPLVIYCSFGNLVGVGFEPLPQVSMLSNLTWLTSLAAKWLTSCDSDEDALVPDIMQTTALWALDIDMYGWEGLSAYAESILQLAAETKLETLR